MIAGEKMAEEYANSFIPWLCVSCSQELIQDACEKLTITQLYGKFIDQDAM